MNTISFKDEGQFNKQTVFCGENEESKMYKYMINETPVLIKIYKKGYAINTNKVELISKGINSNILLKPNYIVEIAGEICGLSKPYVNDLVSLKSAKDKLSDKEKFEIINQLKEEIINLEKQSCIYSGINPDDVKLSGEKIFLTDSLSVKITEYPPEKVTPMIDFYIKSKRTLEGVDIYLTNLLTIYLFNNIEYEDILVKLAEVIYRRFNNESATLIGAENRECLEICADMLSKKPDTKFLIDVMNITKEYSGKRK